MSPNVHRYFLFTSSEEPSLRWLDDVWREAADVEGGEEGPRIHFASVDVATDPALCGHGARRPALQAAEGPAPALCPVPAFAASRSSHPCHCRDVQPGWPVCKPAEREPCSSAAPLCCCRAQAAGRRGCRAYVSGALRSAQPPTRARTTGSAVSESHVVNTRRGARQVFRYRDSDMSAEALRRFARAPASPGEPVPPPPGALELALRALRGNELAVRPLLGPPCLAVLSSHARPGDPLPASPVSAPLRCRPPCERGQPRRAWGPALCALRGTMPAGARPGPTPQPAAPAMGDLRAAARAVRRSAARSPPLSGGVPGGAERAARGRARCSC